MAKNRARCSKSKMAANFGQKSRVSAISFLCNAKMCIYLAQNMFSGSLGGAQYKTIMLTVLFWDTVLQSRRSPPIFKMAASVVRETLTREKGHIFLSNHGIKTFFTSIYVFLHEKCNRTIFIWLTLAQGAQNPRWPPISDQKHVFLSVVFSLCND